MFPAYKKAPTSPQKDRFPILEKASLKEELREEWLRNQSFAKLEVIELKDKPIELSSTSSESLTEAESIELEVSKSKKHKKRSKKKDKKKRIKKEKDRDFDKNNFIRFKDLNKILEKNLCDQEYRDYFSKLESDKIKNLYFYDDFPKLDQRNAFKIDKKGDKNNICFDTVYYKQQCKYNLPRSEYNDYKPSNLKDKKKMSRKQLRRQQLTEAKQKRYFSRLTNLKTDITPAIPAKSIDLAQSSLSNKMWLYLEMKQDLEETNEAQEDLTSDYMKYLNENKHDIQKWLEFIDYQSKKVSVNDQSRTSLFDRKQSIFERCIKENPDNFRLKIESTKLKANSIEMTNYFDSVERIETDFLNLLATESIKLNSAKQFDQTSLGDDTLSNLFEIWFELIKFLQNNNSTDIKFNRIKRIYIKCFIYFLNSSNKHINKWLSSNEMFLNNMLQILESYCSFLTRSGYAEKAIGIYQGLIDFNLSTTSSEYKNLDFKNRKTLFELFCDIGLPKFGEKHSQGWLNCLENREKIFLKLENEDTLLNRYEDSLDIIENKIVDSKSIRIELRWLEIEKLRSMLYWYPFYPNIVLGESQDDCIDQDRLISYDEDLSFCLFDLNIKSNIDEEELRENLKFKLICKFLKLLGVLRIEDDSVMDEDTDFSEFLNEKLPIFKNLFFGDSNVFKNLFESKESFEGKDQEYLKNSIKTLLKNTIDFIRNCLNQAQNSFKLKKYKTCCTILKWKFELQILYFLSKSKKNISQDFEQYFDFETVKQNLVNQTKLDLSLECNRSNFSLWKQYGILKWLLNSPSLNTKPVLGLKETRKVFDTLLKTSESSTQTNSLACIDIYSLCIDYIELELGIYYKQFDVTMLDMDASLTTVLIQNDFFDLKQKNLRLQLSKRKELTNLKEGLSEILINNCLNKTQIQTKSKSKLTFKIGMSGTTKLLLVKRDFQLEYEQLVLEATNQSLVENKKLFLYHKVYSLFLLCINDLERLIEVNDHLLKKCLVQKYHSKLIEFYLSILNYLYFKEASITKFMFKSKLFAIVKSLLFSSQTCTKSFLFLLQTTLIRFKLDNSTVFANQLLENNDIDLMFNQIAFKLSNKNSSNSANFLLSQIFTNLLKLENLVKSSDEVLVPNLGLHHQIRRLFDQAVKLNPRSLQIWVYYWKFEIFLFEFRSRFNLYKSDESFINRILSVYYQSIRNLPHVKMLYLNAVNYLPDKYNEIISIVDKKELRVYLPIQELNIILEPIKRPEELENENENTNKSDDELESSKIHSDEEDTNDESMSEADSTDESVEIDSESEDSNSHEEGLKFIDY